MGTYAFQLLSAASAEQITLGETVTGRPSDRDAGLAAHILPSTAPVAAGPGDTMLRLSQGGPVVTVADDAALRPQALTIETWLRPDAFRQWDTVLMKSSTGSWQDGYGLYLDGSGNLDFFREQLPAPRRRRAQAAQGPPARDGDHPFGSIAALIGVLFLRAGRRCGRMRRGWSGLPDRGARAGADLRLRRGRARPPAARGSSPGAPGS